MIRHKAAHSPGNTPGSSQQSPGPDRGSVYSLDSRPLTGLGSRIALFNSPLQSEALHGLNTFSPGTLPYQAE